MNIIPTIQLSLKSLFTNRYMATLSIALLALALIFLIYIIVSVRPSELQLVTHYTAFGVTQLYRDQWWYLLSFGIFGLLVAFFHIALAIKVYLIKGHPLAIMILWLGVAVLLFAWFIAAAILNVWSPV